MCVGFLDLVGSTALALRLASELGAVLTEFEHTAADTITAGGGRVVKLIGDEVMYVAADESAALHIALNVIAMVSEHPCVPPVRGGVAAGGVLTRNGLRAPTSSEDSMRMSNCAEWERLAPSACPGLLTRVAFRRPLAPRDRSNTA